VTSRLLRARLEQSRGGPRRGLDRVRSRVPRILQTAAAAGIAWELAKHLQPRPYFAPVAAVVAMGAAAGQQRRRAVEISLGVAVGILIGDLIVKALGVSWATLLLVVVLAMSAALLFGASQVLVNQAAVSAVLLVALGIPHGVSVFTRFFSALIGCGVAVVIGPLLFSRDPLARVGHDAEALLGDLAEVLDRTADALASGQSKAAGAALEAARAAEGRVSALEESVAAADEALRLTPPRRRNLPRLRVYADALDQVDFAIRNTRVLARAVETAAVREVPADPALPDAVRLLARAVRALAGDLREPSADSDARRLAREAAAEATAVLDRRSDLSANVIVAQIRSTAADLLRGSGMDTTELRVALGPYPTADAPPER
jgi:uncharacterized membrane protein YgaE (UPF0421/DUF939 family)